MSQPDVSTGDDSRMGVTYLFVVITEIAVVVALWWFGRFFSR